MWIAATLAAPLLSSLHLLIFKPSARRPHTFSQPCTLARPPDSRKALRGWQTAGRSTDPRAALFKVSVPVPGLSPLPNRCISRAQYQCWACLFLLTSHGRCEVPGPLFGTRTGDLCGRGELQHLHPCSERKTAGASLSSEQAIPLCGPVSRGTLSARGWRGGTPEQRRVLPGDHTRVGFCAGTCSGTDL